LFLLKAFTFLGRVVLLFSSPPVRPETVQVMAPLVTLPNAMAALLSIRCATAAQVAVREMWHATAPAARLPPRAQFPEFLALV
jgi:hypothetical protein